eukprot:3919825-Pleurochrysis_carterae.AAC.1
MSAPRCVERACANVPVRARVRARVRACALASAAASSATTAPARQATRKPRAPRKRPTHALTPECCVESGLSNEATRWAGSRGTPSDRFRCRPTRS